MSRHTVINKTDIASCTTKTEMSVHSLIQIKQNLEFPDGKSFC